MSGVATTGNAIQTTVGAQPTYVASTPAFNGYPTVNVDGDDNIKFDFLSTESASLFAVAEGTFVSGGENQLIQVRGDGGIVLYRALNKMIRGRYWSQSTTNSSGAIGSLLDDGVPFIASYILQQGGTSSLYNMRNLSGTASTESHAAESSNSSIGGENSDVQYWNGGIGELIHYDGVVSGTERMIIGNYLSAKYFFLLET